MKSGPQSPKEPALQHIIAGQQKPLVASKPSMTKQPTSRPTAPPSRFRNTAPITPKTSERIYYGTPAKEATPTYYESLAGIRNELLFTPRSYRSETPLDPFTGNQAVNQPNERATDPQPRKIGWFGHDARAVLRGEKSPVKPKPWVEQREDEIEGMRAFMERKW
jgi:hypothetical protein